MNTPFQALVRLDELIRKTDLFFNRVEQRYSASMQCHTGCSDCCHVQLSVTAVEKAKIAEGLRTLPEDIQRKLAQRAQNPNPERCSALNSENKCDIYPFRPLFCRSHGLPIRMGKTAGLPLINHEANSITACFRNFKSDQISSIDADCILDQQTLSTILHVINQAYAAETGEDAGRRFELAAIFRQANDEGE